MKNNKDSKVRKRAVEDVFGIIIASIIMFLIVIYFMCN